MMSLTVKAVSSLTRIFLDTEPQPSTTPLSALRGETVSFQIAYRTDGERLPVSVSVSADPHLSVSVRQVVNVPAVLTHYPETLDDNYERTAPGLFPDVLRRQDGTVSADHLWRSIWVELVPDGTAAGEMTVSVSLALPDSAPLTVTESVRVIPVQLPEQTLLHTRWFHADCLADYYGVEVFSEEHWRILENFMRAAALRGINMLLTPAFTPPLDTAVGGERTTVQLVDVALQNGVYAFGFDKLKRWVDLAERCGIRYFEIAHLFTQWGAKAAPKVMATVDGVYRRIFGWDTPATGDGYAAFLAAYLPALTAKLREWGIADRCFFHISDEPEPAMLPDYRAAKALVAPYLQGFRMMDAISNYAFYETGLVETPVCASNEIEPFLEHRVQPLWAYYCCGQGKEVSNAFFSMPLSRTRILGVQLYKYRYEGFLQWGYNFYNTRNSELHISPYEVTDAGGQFPSGDSFLVYPGEAGEVEESVRLMVLQQAMQDLRALLLLESLIGREKTVALVEEGIPPITMKQYPHTADYLTALRCRVNSAIENAKTG